MKKSLTFVICLVALGAGAWVAIEFGNEKNLNGENCPFCDSSVLSRQTVFQGDGCVALLNYKPAVKGHMLVIPERHIERFEDLTKEEMSEIHSLIAKVDRAERKALGSTGYLLLQKNGAEAGQSVPHVHFHYFPRSKKESKIWLIVRMLAAHWLPPLSEQEIQDQKLRFQGNGLVD